MLLKKKGKKYIVEVPLRTPKTFYNLKKFVEENNHSFFQAVCPCGVIYETIDPRDDLSCNICNEKKLFIS